jgi:hypothetical protein
MQTDDLEYILSKEYDELSASEKAQIQDLCPSEEEFLQMKHFFFAVENYAQETANFDSPAESTKESLDAIFHQTYQSKGILWYNSLWLTVYAPEKKFHQKPLVRVAALLILSLSVLPFVGKQDVAEKQIAKAEVKTKTNEIKSKVSATKKADDTVEIKVPALISTEANQVSLAQVDIQLAQMDEVKTEDIAGEVVVSDKISVSETSANATLCAPGSAITFTAKSSVPTQNFTWAHPDGIYVGAEFEKDKKSENEKSLAVLDLLTPTF